MANAMQFAGTIESEEMMSGELADGRTIMVDMCSKYEYAPFQERDDPEYWLARLSAGEFDDPENYPIVWTVKDGKREWRDYPRNDLQGDTPNPSEWTLWVASRIGDA